MLALLLLMMAQAAVSAPAQPAPSPPLAPSGKWVVEYDQELCAASRTYGDGPAAITLAFRPFPTQPSMEVVLIDHGPGTKYATTGDGAIVLDPTGQRAATAWRSFAIKGGERILHLDVKRADLSQLAAANALTVEAGKRRIALQTPAIAKALDLLDGCETDLIKSWGVDPDLFAGGVTRPEPVGRGLADWFNGDVYPPEAQRAGQQGRVVTLIQIDAAGKVTNCRVVDSSHFPALDDGTCRVLLDRGRYRPAKDTGGQPVASWALQPVKWQLAES
jgi:TonB family protein